MPSKKSVMLIIPEMSVGGAQRSLAKLSVEFAEHFKVFLVVFNNKKDVAYPVGGEVSSLDVHPGNNLLAKGVAFVKRISRLRELKKKFKIDVAISFLEGADYINVLSKVSEKVILSIRGSKVHDENMLNYFFWLRSKILIPWLYKKADFLIAVNEGITKELMKHHGIPPHRIFTIGNFYNREEIINLSTVRREDSIEKLFSNKVLITTGRLSTEKGLDGVIKVFSKLRQKENDITLVIVGDGPDREKLVALCRQLGLRIYDDRNPGEIPDVVFLGSQRNVFKYIRGSSIYLMNSSSEGFPNGLVEAMICGVPVMSSNCPYGPREILAPELDQETWKGQPYFSRYGVLMPIAGSPESIDIWTKTLKELLDNESLRNDLSGNAIERTLDFDKDKIVKRWLEIIKR